MIIQILSIVWVITMSATYRRAENCELRLYGTLGVEAIHNLAAKCSLINVSVTIIVTFYF